MEQRSFLNVNLVRIIVSWLQVWECYTPEPMTLKKKQHPQVFVWKFGEIFWKSYSRKHLITTDFQWCTVIISFFFLCSLLQKAL